MSLPALIAKNLMYDTHDVLVLQVSGSKRWLVYEPVLELPYGRGTDEGVEHPEGIALTADRIWTSGAVIERTEL